MTEIERSALLSPCRQYRYVLRRDWSNCFPLVFVGLNPSTADETEDDATIFRCISLARRWGYTGVMMLNAFAWRATVPREMFVERRRGVDVVGPDNDDWLRRAAEGYDYGPWGLPNFVACWGSQCPADRAREVYSIFPRMYCLRRVDGPAPIHPLARLKITGLWPWEPT